MLARIGTPALRTFVKSDLRRLLRTTSVNHLLIGPPDPVSNLRPVIYDEDEPAALAHAVKIKAKDGGEGAKGKREDEYLLPAVQPQQTSPTHPYLLDEFDGDPVDYQWRVERKRTDAYNHVFWTDSNTRFEAAKQSVLSALPETASSRDREIALSEFYAKWVKQEGGRLKDYSEEWNRRNWANVFLEARAAMRRLRSRLLGNSSLSRTTYPSRGKSKHEIQKQESK